MDFSPRIELGEPDGTLDTAVIAVSSVDQALERVRRTGSLDDLRQQHRIGVRYAKSAQDLYKAYALNQMIEAHFPEQLQADLVTPEAVREYFEGPVFQIARRQASESYDAVADYKRGERAVMTDLICDMLSDGKTELAVGVFSAASDGLDGVAFCRSGEQRVAFVEEVTTAIELERVERVDPVALVTFVEESLGLLQRYDSDGDLISLTSPLRYVFAKKLIDYGIRTNAAPAVFKRLLSEWETDAMRGGEPLDSFASHVRDQVHAATPETASTVLELIKVLPDSAQDFRHEMIDTLGVVLLAQRPKEQENPA